MFKTKDGYINIAANQQEQWENLADELGLPELKTDPRFQERDTRKANRFLLTPLLEAKLTQKTTAHWVEVLNAKGIPSGDVLKPGGGADLRAGQTPPGDRRCGAAQHWGYQDLQPDRQILQDARQDRDPAAAFSEHTEEILTELGYTDEEQKILKEKMVM